MKESMKSSEIKRIVVKCMNWKDEFEINTTIFDDAYMEAATRAIEKRIGTPNFKMAIVMECSEKNKKNIAPVIYNSYFVLINAGQHLKAEALRTNFLKEHGVDLRSESMKGEDGNNTTEPNTDKPE